MKGYEYFEKTKKISAIIISLLISAGIMLPVNAEDSSPSENAADITDNISDAVNMQENNYSTAINQINFPDSNFRNFIAENCDVNNDGFLSYDEALSLTSMSIGSQGISDLKGIEYFINLQYLNAANNDITSIDLSQNVNLTDLILENNPNLKNIDVSQNKQLTDLDVLNCGLSTIDISANTELRKLYCHVNNLTELYTGNNTKLEVLCCWGNKLTSLDLSKNAKISYLYCYNNQFSELFLDSCPDLIYLNCSNNKLTSLDLSNNTVLQYLYCKYNNISALDLSNNTALTDIQVDDTTSITGVKRIPLSVIGFEGKDSYVSYSGDISDGMVYENSTVGLHIYINDYINHEIYINGEKYPLDNWLNGDGYVFYKTFSASEPYVTVELKEEPWTAERLSDYFTAKVDDGIQLYYYNPYMRVITRPIISGDYVRKDWPICLRIEPSLFPEGSYITINGEKAVLELNNDGVYQLWNYIVPDNSPDVLEVKLFNSSSVTIKDITVTDKNVIVTYYDDSTEEYSFNAVPSDIINKMDISDVAAFVNAFSDTNEDLILSDGQIKAVEIMLDSDYAALSKA